MYLYQNNEGIYYATDRPFNHVVMKRLSIKLIKIFHLSKKNN
jgi:hypothetical protein